MYIKLPTIMCRSYGYVSNDGQEFKAKSHTYLRLKPYSCLQFHSSAKWCATSTCAVENKLPWQPRQSHQINLHTSDVWTLGKLIRTQHQPESDTLLSFFSQLLLLSKFLRLAVCEHVCYFALWECAWMCVCYVCLYLHVCVLPTLAPLAFITSSDGCLVSHLCFGHLPPPHLICCSQHCC